MAPVSRPKKSYSLIAGEMTEKDAVAHAIRALVPMSGPARVVEPFFKRHIVFSHPDNPDGSKGKVIWREMVHMCWPGKKIAAIFIPDLGSIKMESHRKNVHNLRFAVTMRRLSSLGWVCFPFTYQEVRYTKTFTEFWEQLLLAYDVCEADADPQNYPDMGIKVSDLVTRPRQPVIPPDNRDLCGPVGGGPSASSLAPRPPVPGAPVK